MSTLEFRAESAPAHMDPKYGGKLHEKLLCDGEWIGTVWQHVCGFSYVLIKPGVGIIAGDECASYDDGRRKLLAAYRGTLPDWDDVRGIAPNATGDMSSEEWIRQQRGEWDRMAGDET